MPLSEAKDLHTEITLLLLQMKDIQDRMVAQNETPLDLKVSGGSFTDK